MGSERCVNCKEVIAQQGNDWIHMSTHHPVCRQTFATPAGVAVGEPRWRVQEYNNDEIEIVQGEEDLHIAFLNNTANGRKLAEAIVTSANPLAAPLKTYEDGLREAVEIADGWAQSHSCDSHDNNPCCHVRTGAGIRDAIRARLEGKQNAASD